MVSNVLKKAVCLLAASFFLVVSTTSWSAVVTENPLDPSYYVPNLAPKIDMTNISLSYNKDLKLFTGVSTKKSTFTLTDPDMETTRFKGLFAIGATIDKNGDLKKGGFTFLSKDPIFGFGEDKWGNVFSGELTDLGWSASGDLVEFATGKFSGWACDQGWCTQAERLWFKTDGFPNTAWTKNWKDKNALGTAVIPVPAAIWLLGSGLMGMIGFIRRKKS